MKFHLKYGLLAIRFTKTNNQNKKTKEKASTQAVTMIGYFASRGDVGYGQLDLQKQQSKQKGKRKLHSHNDIALPH